MNKLLSLSVLSLISLSLNAQELISSQKTKRPNEAKVHLRHFHDDLIISDLCNTYGYFSPSELHYTNRSYYDDIQVYKGEERLVKKYDPTFKSDRGSTNVKGYIFKDDKFSVLNVASDNEYVSQYIREFDYNLKELGKPIKVAESKIETGKSGFAAGDPDIFSEIHYNKKNKTSLLTLNVVNSSKSHITLNVLDENFEVKNTLTLEAKNKTNKFRLAAHRILDNGEVLALIETSNYKHVLSYDLVHLSENNEHSVEEILPAKKLIISTNISENSVNDEVIISILATGEDNESNQGALTSYRYNLKTHEVEKRHYGLNEEGIIKGYKNKIQNLIGLNIEYLEDGSAIFLLSGEFLKREYSSYHARSIIVIKVDELGEVMWMNIIDRFTRSAVKADLTGYLYYITDNGNLEVLFNTPKSYFDQGSYSPDLNGSGSYLAVKEDVIPAKARINLASGDMNIQPVEFSDDVNSISFKSAQEMDEVGQYKLLLNKGKDSFISVVDFK